MCYIVSKDNFQSQSFGCECFSTCMCLYLQVCALVSNLAFWPHGGRDRCSRTKIWLRFYTQRITEEKESICKVMENWSEFLSFFFFSIGFIFLYSSVLSIQGSPTSLSFTLFHQMVLFHMRWFHSEHPLTVNLHTLTLQIHHHTGYV